MNIRKELLDKLLQECKTPPDLLRFSVDPVQLKPEFCMYFRPPFLLVLIMKAAIFGEGGILKQLTTALVERALEAELSTHLGYKKHQSKPEGQSNSRNGYSQKKLQGDFGYAEIAVPRDR